MKKIRVMIVEDSSVVRALLEYSIGRDSRLEVCATAGTAEDALGMLAAAAPDVIVMDIGLPGIDGLEATRRIMSRNPIPIVAVAAPRQAGKWNALAMDALRAGVLTVIEKPVGTAHADYQMLAERLCTQLVIMSQVRLVRQHSTHHPVPVKFRPPACTTHGEFKMLGIVCSAGGPGALVRLLCALGRDFPLPILLVQHMTASFLGGFASWLQNTSPFPVTIVHDGAVPEPGTIHIAPADWHLRLRYGVLRLDQGDPVSFQRPSGTTLFHSMAMSLGPEALGVLLTGMGDDGAAGLLDILRSGGFTIAEDESTAVVYGMPGAAVQLGAVCESLPLPAIAGRILELVSASVLAAGKRG